MKKKLKKNIENLRIRGREYADPGDVLQKQQGLFVEIAEFRMRILTDFSFNCITNT